jgi:hypothetical protein
MTGSYDSANNSICGLPGLQMLEKLGKKVSGDDKEGKKS